MNWTKIPTNILINRLSDQEIASIVKYQLLWAELEYQPDDKTCLRYMTNKQLLVAKQWLNAIETQVKRDIREVETRRSNRKTNYLKNKEKTENVCVTVSDTVDVTPKSIDKIRLNKEIYKESFEQWWVCYPRKIDKKKARNKFNTLLAEKKTTLEELIKGAKNYALHCQEEKTEEKFIKHPTTWLNGECWLNEYTTATPEDYRKKYELF